MLGRYENFPENIHAIVHLNCQNSAKAVQKAILCTVHKMNHEICDLCALNPYLEQKCEVGFEFGVAEGFNFNFLDQKELDHSLKSVDETELQTLDFFFAVRYHLVKEDNKRVPLKFDYHVLRFIFEEGGLEMRIRHEKGIQRATLEDLTTYITEKINADLAQRRLAPLFLEDFQKVGLA